MCQDIDIIVDQTTYCYTNDIAIQVIHGVAIPVALSLLVRALKLLVAEARRNGISLSSIRIRTLLLIALQGATHLIFAFIKVIRSGEVILLRDVGITLAYVVYNLAALGAAIQSTWMIVEGAKDQNAEADKYVLKMKITFVVNYALDAAGYFTALGSVFSSGYARFFWIMMYLSGQLFNILRSTMASTYFSLKLIRLIRETFSSSGNDSKKQKGKELADKLQQITDNSKVSGGMFLIMLVFTVVPQVRACMAYFIAIAIFLTTLSMHQIVNVLNLGNEPLPLTTSGKTMPVTSSVAANTQK